MSKSKGTQLSKPKKTREDAVSAEMEAVGHSEKNILDSEKKPRRKSGATIKISHGDRRMKLYPLTAGELGHLFAFGILTTGAFSLMCWCFNSGLEIYKDLSFNPQLDAVTVARWEGIKERLFDLGWCAFAATLIFAALGGAKIREIKNSTSFDEE